MNIRIKIEDRLDDLQGMMKRQEHLKNPELVMEKLESATKFWSALSEDDRDLVSAVRVAIKDQIGWEV